MSSSFLAMTCWKKIGEYNIPYIGVSSSEPFSRTFNSEQSAVERPGQEHLSPAEGSPASRVAV